MGVEEQPITNKHFKAYLNNAFKHDICREQSIYTRAILANSKICMHDFFCGGAPGGGVPIICGGARAPQAPHPVATPHLHRILRNFRRIAA